MKILKVFGVVVGIHLFALVLIFANPGCTSTSKPTPTPSDTVAQGAPPPPPSYIVPVNNTAPTATPLPFNPDATATVASAAPSNSPGFRPTRPNTPAASTISAPLVSDVTPATTYTVKSGDSLWTIGKRNGLTPAEIAAANNIKVNTTLHNGQKLIIPNKAGAPAATAAKASNGGETGNGRTAGAANGTATTTVAPTLATPAPVAVRDGQKHTVQPGESLSTIAKLYGVTQRDIAVANNITNPARIDAGKELVIPAGKATVNSTPAATQTTPSTEVQRPVFNIMDTPPAASGPSPFPTNPSNSSPFPTKSN